MGESIKLIGQVDQALKAINTHYPQLEEQLDPTITIEPFYFKEDIPEITKLWLEEFTRDPRHFYAAARKSYQKAQKRHLQNLYKEMQLGNPTWMAYLFKNSAGKIIGWADMHSYNKKQSGVQFCFAKELQGKKFGVLAYKLLLGDIKANKGKIFSGNTSNLAVLKLSQKFGRIPSHVMLKNGQGFFPNDYFYAYLDQLEKV